MILNYPGKGLEGGRAGWLSSQPLSAGLTCHAARGATLPPANATLWGHSFLYQHFWAHRGTTGRCPVFHLFCNKIPNSSEGLIFFLSLPPSGKRKSRFFPKKEKQEKVKSGFLGVVGEAGHCKASRLGTARTPEVVVSELHQ